MPRIEGQPGEAINEVWAYLTPAEALLLLEALRYWAEEDQSDPEWHHHIGEAPGPEITIAIER